MRPTGLTPNQISAQKPYAQSLLSKKVRNSVRMFQPKQKIQIEKSTLILKLYKRTDTHTYSVIN